MPGPWADSPWPWDLFTFGLHHNTSQSLLTEMAAREAGIISTLPIPPKISAAAVSATESD